MASDPKVQEPRSGNEYYTPQTEKLTSRAVIFFGQRTHFWGQKYKVSLLERFRQISPYLPEQVPANKFLFAGTGSGK